MPEWQATCNFELASQETVRLEVRTDFVLKNGFEKSLRLYAGQELRREAIDVTGDIN